MSILSSLFGAKKEYSGVVEVLDKVSFLSAISSKKVQVIDVRTPNEFAGGHIKKAVNVDFFKPSNFVAYFEKLDKTKPLYIYCRSGARSKKASHKLADMGFEKIYDLQGGYSNW
ncbi:rhodanese-related sulfurtransferase [Maribacter vaceletii]|uniref:Rhodanese-related sulfurtransferase n=1 Tax=Maribacter vaceletii TaxID=1206816 RepID=A0A495EBT3_9FLAO|nr:rhodanese-like domain-containing protein [Maribacter vaceletii]RKR14286.1 rhodanese-related sulfurtransferase [Maribacter vaceletii]